MTIASVMSGNRKATLVYGTLTILSIFTAAQIYMFNCDVHVIGDKGSAKIGFDNSKPNNPKLGENSIKAGKPNAVGKVGENYVSEELGLPHNNNAVMIDGRSCIPDFYDIENGIIAESKNVANLSYTQQLHDYVKLAQDQNTVLILYTRENSHISGPLQEAIDSGLIEHRVFP